MNIQRFIVVLLIISGLGTVLGAVCGALLGAAVPQQLTVTGEGYGDRAELSDTGAPAGAGGTGETGGTQGTMTLAAAADRPPYAVGAALGAGLGLMAGAVAGLCLAFFDQVLLALKSAQRQETKHD